VLNTCANQCLYVPDSLLIAEHRFYEINFRDWACLSRDDSVRAKRDNSQGLQPLRVETVYGNDVNFYR
jgi:hypothetical protein